MFRKVSDQLLTMILEFVCYLRCKALLYLHKFDFGNTSFVVQGLVQS